MFEVGNNMFVKQTVINSFETNTWDYVIIWRIKYPHKIKMLEHSDLSMPMESQFIDLSGSGT